MFKTMRNIFLGGFGRIGVWILQHWTSLYQAIYVRNKTIFWGVAAVFVGIFLAAVYY